MKLMNVINNSVGQTANGLAQAITTLLSSTELLSGKLRKELEIQRATAGAEIMVSVRVAQRQLVADELDSRNSFLEGINREEATKVAESLGFDPLELGL